MNYSEPSVRHLIRVLAALLPSNHWEGAAAAYRQDEFPELLELAAVERLLPALGSERILELCGFPAEVESDLRQIFAANTKRNAAGRSLAIEVARELNSAGIEPILMKGAAFLAEGLYPMPGARIHADADLVVPETDLPAAVSLVRKMGFTVGETEGLPPLSHHNAPLLHPPTGIKLELHRWFVGASWRDFLPEVEVWRRSRSAEAGGAQVRFLGHTDAVVHNFVHSRLHHGCYFSRKLALRTLYDCGLLVERAPGAIDWADVWGRAASGNRLRALDWHLELCAALFPWAAPHLPVRAAEDPLSRLGDFLPEPLRALQMEWRTRLRLIRQDPQRILYFARRLRNPGTLPRQIVRHARCLWSLARPAS